MHIDYSFPLPWSLRLANILRLASYTSIFNQARCVTQAGFHPPGEIWKHIFSHCIYSDLEGGSPLLLQQPNHRFVRIESFGLSGVILYQIPTVRQRDGRRRVAFSLERAFGTIEYDYRDGMSVSELLNRTDAKLVYFPAYACTSFIVGQVIHAYFMDAPALRPFTARDGFFVPSESLVDLENNNPITTKATLSADESKDDEAAVYEEETSSDSTEPVTPPGLRNYSHHDCRKNTSEIGIYSNSTTMT